MLGSISDTTLSIHLYPGLLRTLSQIPLHSKKGQSQYREREEDGRDPPDHFNLS